MLQKLISLSDLSRNGRSSSGLKSNSMRSSQVSTSLSQQTSSTSSMSVNSSFSSVVLPRSMLMTGRSIPTIGAIKNPIRSFRTSGRSSGLGMPSRSRGYCSSPRVPRESQSTGSRIFRAVMDPEDLPLRSQEKLMHYPSLTPGKSYNHIFTGVD